MDTQVSLSLLPAGTVIEGYTVEQALESEPNVLRYAARNAAGDRVVLVELFPSDTVARDGQRVIVRSGDDQDGWQLWIRSFLERTRQLAALNHPGLVRLRHNFTANGTAYCVIDPLGGDTLSVVLEREGTLPEPKLRQLLFSLIAALEEAHNAGLLHGDIEPSRIRLQFDGKAILSGFATLVTPIRFKGHTTVNAGTPGYAPPEHLLVQAAEKPSSDIYSLAAIAYRAICGEAPPEARMRGAGAELRPSAIAAKGRYSAALTSAIDAGLAMRPQQRPQTLAQWRQLLESEEPPARVVAGQKPARPSPVPWIAGPAALAVAAAGYFVAHTEKAPTPTPVPVIAQAPATEAPSTYNTAPSSASSSLPVPTLDQLAISMLKRGQKPVHVGTPDNQATLNAPRPATNPALAAASASPTGKPATVSGSPAAQPQPGAASSGPKPAVASAPAATPAAAAPVTTEADKSKEQEALQRAAEEEAAQQAQREAAAREAAAKDALAKQTAANEARERLKKTVARAKAKCELPAPELSENENLVFENAMAVPGATRQRDGSVRLPEVTLADGTTARYVIDAESCAHRVQ